MRHKVLGGRKSKRAFIKLEYVAILLILLVSTVLCLAFFYGANTNQYTNGYDYVNDAFVLQSQGIRQVIQFDPVPAVRFILLGGMAIFYRLFGVSQLTSVAFDLFALLGTDIAVYLLGKELYSARAGLISAFLYSFFPLAVFDATNISDDTAMVLLITIAVLFMVLALKRKKHKPEYYMLSGFTGMISILTVAEGPIILLFLGLVVLFYLVRYRTRDRLVNLASFSAGIFVAIGAILLLGYLASGEPLLVFSENIIAYGTNHAAYTGWVNYFSMADYIGGMLHNPLFGHNIFDVNQYLIGNYFYVVLLFALYLAIVREKRLIFVGTWAVITLLFLGYGTESLNYYSYGIQPPLMRYTLIAWPAMVLIVGFGIENMLRVSRGKRDRMSNISKFQYAICIVIALMVIGALFYQSVIVLRWLGYSTYRDMYELVETGAFINSLPNGRGIVESYLVAAYIYTDHRHNPYYFFSGELNCSSIGPNSYLVYYQNDTLQEQCNFTTVYSAPPPPAWLNDYTYCGLVQNVTVYYKPG